MQKKVPSTVVFFQELVSGKEPVRDWIKGLQKADRITVGHDLYFLQCNWPLGMPFVKTLGTPLWELRINLDNRIARVVFVVMRDKIILLNAFIKKTQKTPQNEIVIALRRLQDVALK